MVGTAHADRGAVTNSHSKQDAKRPKGRQSHRMRIAKTKKQTDDQDQSPAKSYESTHLTPMREGNAFRTFGE
jgi:hypothetical protein